MHNGRSGYVVALGGDNWHGGAGRGEEEALLEVSQPQERFVLPNRLVDILQVPLGGLHGLQDTLVVRAAAGCVMQNLSRMAPNGEIKDDGGGGSS